MRTQIVPQNIQSLQNLLTVDEVAGQLKLSPKTIRKLCGSRRITAVRLQRQWRIPAIAVSDYLRDRLIPHV